MPAGIDFQKFAEGLRQTLKCQSQLFDELKIKEAGGEGRRLLENRQKADFRMAALVEIWKCCSIHTSKAMLVKQWSSGEQ